MKEVSHLIIAESFYSGEHDGNHWHIEEFNEYFYMALVGLKTYRTNPTGRKTTLRQGMKEDGFDP